MRGFMVAAVVVAAVAIAARGVGEPAVEIARWTHGDRDVRETHHYQRYGYAVALSGPVAAIGAPYRDPNGQDSGAVHIRSAQAGWAETQVLHGESAADHFGWAVALDLPLLVVGADGVSRPGVTHSGAAYLYRWEGDTMVHVADLAAPAPIGDSEFFGEAVAVAGSTVVVAAPWRTQGDQPQEAGTVFVFVVGADSDSVELEATLTASDAVGNDGFGFAVAAADGGEDGRTLVAVGAPYTAEDARGALYLFARAGQRADDVEMLGEAHLHRWVIVYRSEGITPGGMLGQSVAVDLRAGVIFAGAHRADDGTGSVAVLHRDCTTLQWSRVQTLQSPSAEPGMLWGLAVDISFDKAVVGTYKGGIASVFLFQGADRGWEETGVLKPNGTVPSDKFGSGFNSQVAVDGRMVLVGAPGVDHDEGAVFAFDMASGDAALGLGCPGQL